MRFAQRSYDKELLDEDKIPFPDIIVNMRELNVVNTFLGGHGITCKGIRFFLGKAPADRPLSIAEIGCGGGDNLTAVHDFLQKKNLSSTLTGIDIKAECLRFAGQNAAKNIAWICSDYRTVVWPGDKPDIIFSSLFCHHFTDEELAEQLKWLKGNSKLGFFINDLHRHPLAWLSISLLTKLFSKSYLVKNDAPLSVMRGFKRKEWERLFAGAGITKYQIKWQWAFRYLICVPNEQ